MQKTGWVLVAFLGLFTSCKNNGSSTSEENIQAADIQQIPDTLFTITLNATVLKDDSFQVYYKQNNQNVYQEENSLFTEFSGSETPQDIVFRLPEGVIPDNIRLDFGTNKEQSPIKINRFTISYFGKKFEAFESDFFNYLLVETKTATFDKNNSTINPLLIDGVYDPQSTSEQALYEQIQRIVK